MKTALPIALACAFILVLLAAGCTQTAQPAPTPVPTAIPTTESTMAPTPVPTVPTPVPTTIAPAIPLPMVIKDTPLLFTVFAPAGYTGTTIRVKTSDYSSAYKTTIFNPATSGTNTTVDDNSGNYVELPGSLTIFSYSTSFSVDQNIRNIIRESGAEQNESTVSYNDITYTRFDVTSDPYTRMADETVIFVGNKASANENGFLPVIIYSMTPNGTISQATYENMAKSFAYYTHTRIGSASGVETDRPSFYQ